jgi:hypothetical protein
MGQEIISLAHTVKIRLRLFHFVQIRTVVSIVFSPGDVETDEHRASGLLSNVAFGHVPDASLPPQPVVRHGLRKAWKVQKTNALRAQIR